MGAASAVLRFAYSCRQTSDSRRSPRAPEGTPPRQNRFVGFILAGFDERDGTTPTWLPDTECDDLDDAVVAAEKWIAGRPNATVDVVQVAKQTGRVVLSITIDGVEKLAPIHRERSADDTELLRQARRRPVTVNTATIRRGIRSTSISTLRPISQLIAAIDDELAAALDWTSGQQGTGRLVSDTAAATSNACVASTCGMESTPSER